MMGLNPRKAAQLMKQMGIKQEDIPASEVIIKTLDKELVIKNPSVAKVEMAGQSSFQISGEVEEREPETELKEEDIKTVMEQTSCTEEQAKKALEENNGDLAKAILSLKKED